MDTGEARSEIAYIRGRVYRLLSLSLLYPDEDFFASLCKGSFIEEFRTCLAYLASVSVMEKGESALEILDALEGVIKKEIQGCKLSDLTEKYSTVFGHTVSSDYPPNETHYGAEHVFQKTQELGDLAGFYKAFGFERSDKLKETFDHISIELEFMYALAFKEGHALEHHGSDKADICIDAQKKFLRDHVARWIPLFAVNLEEKSKDAFFERIAVLLKIVIEMDVAYLKVKPRRLKAPELVSEDLESSDTSYTCEMECGVTEEKSEVH